MYNVVVKMKMHFFVTRSKKSDYHLFASISIEASVPMVEAMYASIIMLPLQVSSTTLENIDTALWEIQVLNTLLI